jgi:hypothetical protein
MKMAFAGFALTLPLILSVDASAYVFGGSNFGFSGYPDPTCYKPMRPFDLTNQLEVDLYNNDLNIYIQCVKEYLENADNDRKRIEEKEDDAIAKAKSPY